jgi:uncharacterized protein
MSHDLLFWSALAIGFAGSLHCIGMCGPIVMVLPGSIAERWKFFAGRVMYNVGRVFAYALLGVVAGLIGQAFTFAGWQQRIGVMVGAVMILGVLVPAVLLSKRMPRNPLTGFVRVLKDRLGRLLAESKTSSLFLIGFFNGFLPCGLVYTAMIGSIAAGQVLGSVLYMALFGVGTIPVMLGASYAANFITLSLRRKLTKMLPVGVVVLGVLFMLRGLGLGIPFISPNIEMMKKKTEKMTQSARRGNIVPTEDATPPCCAGDSAN